MSQRRRIPQPRVAELQVDPDAVLKEVAQREEERLGLEPGLLEDEFALLETDIEFVRWFVEETDFWKTVEEEARFVCGAWKASETSTPS
jgi:hypothetical protein